MTSETKTDETPAAEGPPIQRFNVSIYRSWCKACGICVTFCPHDVFDRTCDRPPGAEYPAIVMPVQCTGCQQCVLHCPDFAIRVDRIPNTEK